MFSEDTKMELLLRKYGSIHLKSNNGKELQI